MAWRALIALLACACLAGCARKPATTPAPPAPPAYPPANPVAVTQRALPPAPKMAVPPVGVTKAASGERVRIIRTLEEKGSYSFGPFKVSIVAGRAGEMGDRTSVAKVTHQGRQIWLQKVCPFATVRLADLNRDGLPEVIVSDFSMGAHCCFEHWVLTPEAKAGKVREILHWEARDVDIDPEYGHRFEFLSGRPFAEILTRDARFAYACGLSFADSPMPRKVFTYYKGKYVPATLAFPGLIRKEQERAMHEFEEAASAEVSSNEPEAQDDPDWMPSDAECLALEAYAYGVMLGERKATVARLGKLGNPRTADWLYANVREADGLLAEKPF